MSTHDCVVENFRSLHLFRPWEETTTWWRNPGRYKSQEPGRCGTRIISTAQHADDHRKPLGVNDRIINGESLHIGPIFEHCFESFICKATTGMIAFVLCVFCINILQTQDNTTRDFTLDLSFLIILSVTHMILIVSIFMIRWGHIIQILLSFRKVTVDTRLLLNCPACGILSHHWVTL